MADSSCFTLEVPDLSPQQGWQRGCSSMAPAQFRVSLLSPTEMLRDIIREYTDVYPEIIERACFVLEKVRRQD